MGSPQRSRQTARPQPETGVSIRRPASSPSFLAEKERLTPTWRPPSLWGSQGFHTSSEHIRSFISKEKIIILTSYMVLSIFRTVSHTEL